jgi:hypothetical protein
MASLAISQFPGMYRLDPVQRAQKCDQDVMISSTGIVCAAKPIKDTYLADVESSLFGITDNVVAPVPTPLPVPSDVQTFETPSHDPSFLQSLVRYKLPQRGQSVDRFIHEYPWKKNVEPFDLYVGVNSRQLYKM